MGKSKKIMFRSTKHDELTLWDGNHKIQFRRNMFVTEDSREIAFLKKVMDEKPAYKIEIVDPDKVADVIEYIIDEDGNEVPADIEALEKALEKAKKAKEKAQAKKDEKAKAEEKESDKKPEKDKKESSSKKAK